MVLSKLDPDRQLMDSGTLPGPFEYAKRRAGTRWEAGVNRTILAIAKPPVDFKRSDTLWLIRLFHAPGQPCMLPIFSRERNSWTK